MTKKILVTGANGQLGTCLQKLAPDYQWNYDFIFADSEELDITTKDQVQSFFSEHQPDFCINAAAYTAVDLAETETEKCYAVNASGVENLAAACAEFNTAFIHISTDYVFDGDTEISYDEDNFTNPQSVYGHSKLEGEALGLENNPKTIIIRTSWLYSEFHKNFMNTMLNLFPQKEEMNIVDDQFGQPTNANDLAEAILKIVDTENPAYGIFHFSNYPETTWYQFAKKIAQLSGSTVKLNPVSTAEFPTAAKRPMRSTMCLDKIENVYNIELHHWENSLETCIKTKMSL